MSRAMVDVRDNVNSLFCSCHFAHHSWKNDYPSARHGGHMGFDSVGALKRVDEMAGTAQARLCCSRVVFGSSERF